MGKLWGNIKNVTLDLLYPASIYCISCGNVIDNSRPYALCDLCVRTAEWSNSRNVCQCCGKLLCASSNAGFCDECAEWTPAFDKGFACAEYGGVRNITHAFKYGGKAYYGEAISEMMFDRLRDELPEIDIVAPVPMHKDKERKRGYNQADVLASLLAKKLLLPYDRGVLIRKRATDAMSRLGSSVRSENIKGAFRAEPNRAKALRGRKILLVDDIYTTGSTMNECALALKAAGAKAVYFVVFATGTDRI